MSASAPPVPGRIFISYRREETAYPAGWLYDRLISRFGGGQVFKDIDSIQLGDDFVEVITRAVASCDVLLALIGNEWLTITDERGRRRLDDPDDFVRLEIEAALTREVRVIPILVDGARMPRVDELPDSLGRLVRRQALELSPSRFEFDTSRLLKVLDLTLARVRTAHDDAAWKAEPASKAPDPSMPQVQEAPERPERAARPPSDRGKLPEPDTLRRRFSTRARILIGTGVGVVLILLVPLIVTIVSHGRTTTTVPRSLEDVAADFGPAIDSPGHFTLDTLEGIFPNEEIPEVRPQLKSLGFRRGFRRTAKSSNGELWGVWIMEFESPAAAKIAYPRVSACRHWPQSNLNIPSVEGAIGRRCKRSPGGPAQEAAFTRGPLLFLVKLEHIHDPESTTRIVEMARVQAEKAG
jgi:hypothetical protein